MSCYLVRLTKNHDIVGLFWVDTIAELQDVVDQCTSLGDCKYAMMPYGGIFWPKPDTQPVPYPPPPSEDEEDEHYDGVEERLMARAELAESTGDAVLYIKGLTWKLLGLPEWLGA